MYIRTREGSAQGPLQYTFGDAPAKPCKPKYLVTHFRPGSSKLLPLHAKILRDIAKHIVRTLQSQKVKAGITGKADIDLVLHFEGHVDKKTDPSNFRELDADRASIVQWALEKNIVAFLKGQALFMRFEYAHAGSLPISTDSRTNRGVVVCVRSIKVKQASP